MMDSGLHDDLLLLILRRLQVKTLCKLKCVSTQWRDLISDTYFIDLYRQQSKRNPKVLLSNHITYYQNDDPVYLSTMTLEEFDNNCETTLLLNQFTPFAERHYIEILSCKGEIVCLAAENKFYVCNPSTREFVLLPDPSPSTSNDPDSAFGYIPSMNEYKLVHLYTDQFDVIGCEIFTISDGKEVGSRSWRVIREKCPYPVQGNGVMVNNIFYWVILFDEEDYNSVPELIICFDLKTETFGTMTGPQLVRKDLIEQVELRGSLCVVDNYSEHSTMVIWMLKSNATGFNNDQEVWEKEYNIYVSVGFDYHKLYESDIVPVYDGDEEIILRDRKKIIYYYNIQTGKIRRVANEIIRRMHLGLYIDGFFSLVK